MKGEGGAQPSSEQAADQQTVQSRRVSRSSPSASTPPDTAGGKAADAQAAGAGAGEAAGHGRSQSWRTGVTDAALNEVLLAEEATRMRGFCSVIAPLSIGVAMFVPLLGGDVVGKWICVGALLLIGVASAFVARIAGHPDVAVRTDRRVSRSYGVFLLFGVLGLEYYFGFFSPVAIILIFGAYYFGQSHDWVQSLVLPALVIVSYSLLAGLTACGVLDDRGLFSGETASFGSKAFAIAAVSVFLMGTLWQARVSRGAVREAIMRSNEALLIAQRREAQLAEAHFQLDRALALGVGKPGRYTGETAGPYQLELVIGMGAVGEVYSGRKADGSQAAVKLLQAGALGREDLVERIVREGSITSALNNQHLVKVLDAGRLRDGAPYVAMELLRGRDLAARLRHEGQLALDDVVLLAHQVCDGLQDAHAAGIVHRDLKPLNIFEAELADGKHCWKILDFGISKLSSSTGTLTREGVIGTPGYMSPEQARGAAVDERSDLFSMAVVIYRALTGQPAFPGENTPQIMFDIVYKMPKQPSSALKGLPSELDLVMMIALAKNAEDRFASARELAEAIAAGAKNALPTALRERGIALSRRYPWGTNLTGRVQAGPV